MKTMMIFDQLVNLHRERHRHFRLDPSRVDHGFAAQTNSVPIAMEEVPDAALFYPCVFIEREGTHAMTALLGLRAQHNLFVGPDRQWVADTYVPAHVRRYPFALAETPTPDNFLICLDEGCAGLNDTDTNKMHGSEGQHRCEMFDDWSSHGAHLCVRKLLTTINDGFQIKFNRINGVTPKRVTAMIWLKIQYRRADLEARFYLITRK